MKAGLTTLIASFCLLAASSESFGQPVERPDFFYGFILNREYEPVSGSHIINLKNGHATVSDKTGYFKIKAGTGDFLLFKNLVFEDTIIRVEDYRQGIILILKEKHYPIEELKIFNWGNSYEDFKKALLNMPEALDITEKLGFKHPDPDYLPFYLDENKVKNPLRLITNPVSYLYYNLSRREKILRKAIRYSRDKKNEDYINRVISRENIHSITGFQTEKLDRFMIYLNSHIRCDYHCLEFEIIDEIYYWWSKFNEEEENNYNKN